MTTVKETLLASISSSNLAERRVALIGGAGFIGHNLALALKERGAEVEVIDGLEAATSCTTPPCRRTTPRDLYIRDLLERLDLLAEAGIALHRQDARGHYHGLSRAALSEFQPDTIVQCPCGEWPRDGLNKYLFDHCSSCVYI